MEYINHWVVGDQTYGNPGKSSNLGSAASSFIRISSSSSIPASTIRSASWRRCQMISFKLSRSWLIVASGSPSADVKCSLSIRRIAVSPKNARASRSFRGARSLLSDSVLFNGVDVCARSAEERTPSRVRASATCALKSSLLRCPSKRSYSRSVSASSHRGMFHRAIHRSVLQEGCSPCAVLRGEAQAP